MDAASIPSATGERRVWLRVGTLLDGISLKPLRDAHMVYDARSILYVGGPEDSPPAGVLNPGQDQPDLDLTGHTLLPGLIEAHAHFFLEGGELDVAQRAASLKQSREALLSLALGRLEKLLRLGVIAVRDAGDKDGVGLALSKLYKSGARPLMPLVDSPGAAIYHRGRYGGFMGEPLEDCASPADCVRARVEAGADRIKLIPTGIINFKEGRVTTEPQMTGAEVSELVRAAKSLGRPTFAHASGETGIGHAIAGGVDSIEHGYFVRDDQLAEMRDRQIAWVPTFAPVQAQVRHAAVMGWDKNIIDNMRRILERHAAAVVKGHALGVAVLAGSDAGSYGVPHGLGLLDEMELMERAGLSSPAVLNAATGVSANAIFSRENFGRLQVGHRSRFILTRHSPLDGIANLKKTKTVIYDGTVFGADAVIDSGGL